jgi:hypothetical protein
VEHNLKRLERRMFLLFSDNFFWGEGGLFHITIGQYKIKFALSVIHGRKVCQSLTFLPVSKARANEFYIFGNVRRPMYGF